MAAISYIYTVPTSSYLLVVCNFVKS